MKQTNGDLEQIIQEKSQVRLISKRQIHLWPWLCNLLFVGAGLKFRRQVCSGHGSHHDYQDYQENELMA